MHQNYDLEDRLLKYSARIIRLVEKLPNTGRETMWLGSYCAPAPRHYLTTAKHRPLNRRTISSISSRFVLRNCGNPIVGSVWSKLCHFSHRSGSRRWSMKPTNSSGFSSRASGQPGGGKELPEPIAFGLRCWKLDVEGWKFSSAGRKVGCDCNKTRSGRGSASVRVPS